MIIHRAVGMTVVTLAVASLGIAGCSTNSNSDTDTSAPLAPLHAVPDGAQVVWGSASCQSRPAPPSSRVSSTCQTPGSAGPRGLSPCQRWPAVSGFCRETSLPMWWARGGEAARAPTTRTSTRWVRPTSSARACTRAWSSITTSPRPPKAIGLQPHYRSRGGSRVRHRPTRRRPPQQLPRSIPSQPERSPSAVRRPASPPAAGPWTQRESWTPGSPANSTSPIRGSPAPRLRTVSASSLVTSVRATCGRPTMRASQQPKVPARPGPGRDGRCGRARPDRRGPLHRRRHLRGARVPLLLRRP